jgi:hypothetical protein
MSSDGVDLQQLVEFQTKFQVDDRCIEYIGQLPPQIQAAVVSGFSHGPDQTNPSARCISFAKRMMQSDQSEAFTARRKEFQAKWGIDDRCSESLATLSSEVQAQVYDTFTHSPEQTNVSARCFSFAKSIEKSLQQNQMNSQAPSAAYYPAQAAPYQAHPAQAMPPQSYNMSNDLWQFQQWWQVDDKCMQYIASLPPPVQSAIVNGFDHSPGQTNVSARCFSFAKAKLQQFQGQGQGQPSPVSYGYAPPSITPLMRFQQWCGFIITQNSKTFQGGTPKEH